MYGKDRTSTQTSGGRDFPDRLEAQRRRIITGVVAALDSDRCDQAVQLFKDGFAHNVLPHGTALQHWLVETLGKPMTAKLVNAYVHAPCLYCTHGLETCNECAGNGHFEDLAVCEHCLGLGIARCDFCDGLGWMANSCIPDGLRTPVVLGRAQEAMTRINKLCRQFPAPSSHRDPSDTLAQCANILLKLNGLLGVLENEVVAARDLHLSALHTKQWIATTVRSWVQTARMAETRMHEALDCMNVSARSVASESPEGSKARALSLARAEFYEELSASKTFEGTGLSHPILAQAVHECLCEKRSPGPHNLQLKPSRS